MRPSCVPKATPKPPSSHAGAKAEGRMEQKAGITGRPWCRCTHGAQICLCRRPDHSENSSVWLQRWRRVRARGLQGAYRMPACGVPCVGYLRDQALARPARFRGGRGGSGRAFQQPVLLQRVLERPAADAQRPRGLLAVARHVRQRLANQQLLPFSLMWAGPNISSRPKWMGRQTFASLRRARAFPQAFGVL